MTSIQPANVASLLERSLFTDVMVLHEDELGAQYFRLGEGLPGELFQKLTNYGRRLALIVSDEAAYGERVRELIHEHRTHPTIRFFRSREAADAWTEKLTKELT